MYYKIKELETMEFNSFKYIFNCIKLYMRIFHILFILIQSYIEFNWNNFILYLKGIKNKKYQFFLKNKGLTRINYAELYNIKKKADIIVNLELVE